MTGVDVNLIFETQIDELYSGYWDDADKNVFFATAINVVTTDILKRFQSNELDTSRLLPLLNNVDIPTPAGNSINISKTAPDISPLKMVFFIEPMFDSPRRTIHTSEVSYSDFGALYSAGTVRYPKYTFVNGYIDIYPKTPAITTCKVWYMSEPVYINVSDNVDIVPYTDEMIQLVVRQAIVEASRSTREYSMSQIEAQTVNKEIN